VLALRHRKSRLLGLRHAAALPVYTVALILSYLSDALGRLADRRRRLAVDRAQVLPREDVQAQR
jgi:hypothetical protein